MPKNDALENKKTEAPFSSNSVRLSIGQWIIVTVICLAAMCLTPAAWERYEKFSPEQDYRIPYELGNDYRLYERYCRTASSQNETLVVGDSVIWGHYVSRENTLSHYLNELTKGTEFANLGLDGIHPAAMEGLLRYYGKNITNKNVIVHFNPLWLSSPKQDLQSEKEFVFNHPKLVAQFSPRIPCYKASFSTRISAVLRRYCTLPNWISHMKITYFQSMALPAWTLENPYRNPLKAVTFQLPDADDYEKSENSNRPSENIGTDGFQWVMPDTSFQWSCFRRTIQLLRQRGNRVFVLVGPFNEHMLEKTSREAYKTLKDQIKLWLAANNIDCYIPPALPVEFYEDASHPTSEGYTLLARQLSADEIFEAFCLPGGSAQPPEGELNPRRD